ncbi:uncharacterized protein STEHIDRAFT_124054 [Stereum hirsutum FP-91666 SS1]|uniref:uncharacterized protein n=1 Tax=Stereum hirsutum (strain FP-91666) TaxID=721885 RepID=UPI0004449ED0|nr:uncharacterized protein STEHIDRAFT_124054 [Stereum hirsutum FP-91666 SS1]EIM82682.1 hypothetical protein STEHIDRAFT_124054 [Stereum hirsutum FP-91666 SS1]
MHASLSRSCSRVSLNLLFTGSTSSCITFPRTSTTTTRNRTTRHPKPHVLYIRHASSSANPFPYPSDPRPTPHQIFHLPKSASQADVKDRYYELVRIYHPDSPVARAYPPHVSQERFHAISGAYNVLRGRPASSPHSGPSEGGDGRVRDWHNLSTEMWKVRQRRKAHAELNVGAVDERWKDRAFVVILAMSVGVFFWQSSSSRQQSFKDNINQARMRAEAREQFIGVDRERERRAARAVKRAEEIRREEKLLSADSDDGEVDRRPS